MKKWNSQVFTFSLVGVLTILGGCSLDETSSTPTSPALTLTATQNLSLTTLTWQPVKVTGFKEYILLQSSTDIPNNPTPEVTQDITVIKRIDDVDVTSFSLSSTLSTTNVCFKLYCSVDDRFLYSSTLCIDQDITIIPGFYDRACHETGRDEMVMFDRINNNLSSCNYKTATITKTVTDLELNFPSLELSTWNDVTNVFGFDQSPSYLRKYAVPSLAHTQFKLFNQILWATNAHHQFIFAATEDPNKNFQVLNRTNLNVLDSKPGITGNQNVAVFDGDPLVVFTFGELGSKKYTIDNAGKVTQEETLSVTLSQSDIQSNCAEGPNLFIGGRQGTIINRNGEKLGVLNPTQNNFIFLTRLTPDESYVVYTINDNNSFRIEIADITALPVITKVQSYDLPSLTFSDLIIEDDIIYLIGALFNNSQPETYILKYPMTP